LLSDPRLGVCADSLVTRCPEEVEGYFYAATARNALGDFLGAMPCFERVVAMDSIAKFPAGADCRACNALTRIYSSFVAVDSFAAAERMVRRWTRLLPQSALGWHSALATAGDTTRLQWLADSVRAIGALSGFGRDRLLRWRRFTSSGVSGGKRSRYWSRHSGGQWKDRISTRRGPRSTRCWPERTASWGTQGEPSSIGVCLGNR
jgi:hypothetical protein